MNTAGSMDIWLALPGIYNEGENLVLHCDHIISSNPAEQDGMWIKIERSSTYHVFSYGIYGSATPIEQYRYRLVSQVRYLLHDKFLTVYGDDKWVYTFSLSYMDYQDDPNIRFTTNIGSGAYLSAKHYELSDWREAVWIDIDSSPSSALSSVIQERPIDIVGRIDGSVDFFYDPVIRSTVTMDGLLTRRHPITYSYSPKAASDTIIYYMDVMTYIDEDAARDAGFSTRILRVPNLENGALRAAQVDARKARQSRERHDMTSRFHPQIETGDKISVRYTVPGIGISVSEAFIVEGVSYRVRAGESEINLQGRSAFDRYSPFPRGIVRMLAVPSQEAIGWPIISHGPIPSGIPSALAFGSPTIASGVRTITLTGIATSLAFGSPVITRAAITVVPTGIATAAAFGSPTITGGS